MNLNESLCNHCINNYVVSGSTQTNSNVTINKFCCGTKFYLTNSSNINKFIGLFNKRNE